MDLTFNKKTIYNYWKQKDSCFLELIKIIESLEYWILDHNYHTMVYLSFLKESAENWNIDFFISQAHKIIDILTYLSFSTAIYFLSYLKHKYNMLIKMYIGFAINLAKEQNKGAIIFLERVNTLAINNKLHHIAITEDFLCIIQFLNCYNTIRKN